uniref:NADH:ubiquinone reductase (H(+)-translocating) n=5 Tax=Antipatharia TaxID=44168 RepID=A0A6M4RGP0_9CNID|nr:NADH dehydrogenase subunit 2 [Parantipathes cf. hirondelle NB-2020]QJS34561.1 NADH dehydrogenase subunit 2 [Parantipathes hirondelle]QJS34574.1 NADH dehydrogenase subunit 2 [Parantipathes sp. NB-2020]QJS34601.1 NADH dehydrogenase subunit 2 [Sibopathes cf. macrospina NB-2020]
MGELLILSIIILGLVVYSVNGFPLKLSILTLLVINWWGFSEGAGIFNLFPIELLQSLLYDLPLKEYNGLLTVNSWAESAKLVIIIGSIAVLLMIDPSGKRKEETFVVRNRALGGESPQTEAHTPVLILMVTLGGVLLVLSSNWLSVYLAIELPTLSLFILAAQKRGSGHSAESGLKYFVLGALSSGLFLFGCALLCGLTGGASIPCIDLVLNQGVAQTLNSAVNQVGDPSGVMTPIGSLLITIALLFKLSAAPFHMWAPDVYDGAPTTTTALLATVPKMAIFSILVTIGPVVNLLLIGAVFSMVVGAIGALNQTKVKRLLAYSGIGHMGFVLWGIEIGSFESVLASLIYMILYVTMSICIFAILLALGVVKNLIVEFSGLSRREPVLAFTLALTLLSIAGIPPLVGFLSKWLVLLSGVVYQYYLVSILAVICSVVAGVYYVRIVKVIYFQADSSLLIGPKTLQKENRVNLRKSLLIGASLYPIGFTIVSPNLLLQVAHWATMGLF